MTSQYGHKMMQNHKLRSTCANSKSTGLKLARVDVLQELHLYDSGYDVTIATHSLPDLYLPKIKHALLVAPEECEADFLVHACAV